MEKQRIRDLEEKYTHPFEYTFWVKHIGGGMSVELYTDNYLIQDIKELHDRGYYRDRPIHISL